MQHLLRSLAMAGGVGCGVAATGAEAAFIPVSQHRYIFESVGEDFFTQSAPDFGPFSAALSAASQNSTIGPLSITGAGSVGPDPFFGINSATSYFELVFDVAEQTDFTFTGGLSTGLFGFGSALLSGPGGDIVNLTISDFETVSWNETGVLDPGQYTLTVFSSNSIGGDLSTFDFSLTVPAPSALAGLALVVLCGPRRRRPANA